MSVLACVESLEYDHSTSRSQGQHSLRVRMYPRVNDLIFALGLREGSRRSRFAKNSGQFFTVIRLAAEEGLLWLLFGVDFACCVQRSDFFCFVSWSYSYSPSPFVRMTPYFIQYVSFEESATNLSIPPPCPQSSHLWRRALDLHSFINSSTLLVKFITKFFC